MKLTREQNRKIKSFRWVFAVSLVAAPLYTILVDGFDRWYPFLMAFLIGPSIVLIFALFELFIFEGRIRKIPFLLLLLVRVLAYFLAILFCVLSIVILVRMLEKGHSFQEEIQSTDFINYLKYGDFKTLVAYVFGLVILTSFTLQMNRKMGQGVLKGFLTGEFREPREKDVFIMFLKFRNAADFIQKLGDRAFLNFYNEVIYDITNTIIYNKGILTSYDDDEMLIIWDKQNGIENAHVIRLYFEICEELDQHKVTYFEKYGGLPRFDAAVHYGTVVCGEIGQVKSEIRYHGDATNTTHRILQFASESESLLTSKPVLELVRIPKLYASESMGMIRIRGKDEQLELFRIHDKNDLS